MKKPGLSFPFLFGGIFLAVGLTFLIFGIYIFNYSNDFTARAQAVTATIDRVETRRDSDGDTEHTVFVSYEYGGKSFYEVPINYYTSGMRRGNEITVLCDPDDPARIEAQGASKFLYTIFTGMGALFVLIGVIPVILGIRAVRNKDRLLRTGTRIDAVVDEISQNRSMQANGRHPYVVYCSHTGPDGKIYRFKSRNIWTNPNLVLKVGDAVPVYVDATNYGKNYVDIESLINGRIVDYT